MRLVLIPAFYHIKTWVCNLRVWASVLFGMGICLHNSVRYLSFINGIDGAVQIFEPYILIGNRVPYFMGILLGSLLLLSDAPFVIPMSQYEMLRIGRKRWFWGQVVYIFLACILYSLMMLWFTCVITVTYSETFLGDNWSAGMCMLAEKQPEFVVRKFAFSFPYPDLINTLSPCKVMAVTVAFNSLYMCFIGCCIFAVNLWTGRNLGWIVAAMIHILGYISYANGGLVIPMKYSLLCCAVPAYHYIDEFGMSASYSLALLSISSLFFTGIGKVQVSKSEIFG